MEQVDRKLTANIGGLSRRDIILKSLPFVLAICAGMASLRGAFDGDIATSDGARHAMNGALLRDWLWTGNLYQPVEFAKEYYTHLPCISLPYHPPMLPALEAVPFHVFGVHVWVSRAVVACFVAVSVLVMHQVLFRQYGNRFISMVSVIVFVSLGQSIRLATDIYLEFPSLAFAILAVSYLREIDGRWLIRDGIMFGLLGGIAVWTKQHAVFIGLIPFFYIILSRKWYLLLSHTLWISIAIYSALVLALIFVSSIASGVGVSGQMSADRFGTRFEFYADAYFSNLGLIPGIVCAMAGVVYLVKRVVFKSDSPSNDLMLGWALSVIAMLAVLVQYEGRYLFYILPAMIVLGSCGIYEFCSKWFSPRIAKLILGAGASLMVVSSLGTAPNYLRGVGQAAEYVVNKDARRVMYCGYFEGPFSFAIRVRSAPLQRYVLRGDKLTEEEFAPVHLEDFLHRYGIDYVVVEQNRKKELWDYLTSEQPEFLELEQEFGLVTDNPIKRGKLFVFRFNNPSPEPADPSSFQLSRLGTYLGKFTGVQKMIEQNEP